MSEISVDFDHPNPNLDEKTIVQLVRDIVSDQGGEIATLSIVLTGHEVVADLNNRVLGRNRQTDVLAFPLGDKETDQLVVDGEIYVDLDTALERAPEFGASYTQEAIRYVIHGVLHLLGYDDGTTQGKALMRELEEKYLPQ